MFINYLTVVSPWDSWCSKIRRFRELLSRCLSLQRLTRLKIYSFLLPFSSILNRIISNFVHFNMTLLSYRWSKRLREHESNKFEHRNRIIRMLEALISLSERGMRTIDRRRKFTRTAHASRRANGAKYGEQGGRHWMQIGRLRGDHVRHPCAESVSFLLLFSSFDYFP